MKRIGLSLLAAILMAMCPALGQPMDKSALPGTGSNIAGTSISQVQRVPLSVETKGEKVRWYPLPVDETSQALPESTLPRILPSAPQSGTLGLPMKNSGSVVSLPTPISTTNRNTENSGLLLASTSASAPELDSPQGNSVAFASPVVAGDRVNASFNPSGSPSATAPTFPQPQPVANELQKIQPQTTVQANTLHVFQNTGVPANSMPVAAPAVTARPIAQNAITQSHRLRLPAQVFEKNLVEKLGSRSVPAQNVAANPGVTQYRLPARDGTAIDIAINRQQGMVSITGAPAMVDASLRIVRLLDVEETDGAPITRFVPVQQSSANAARQVANIVNQETQRVAQVDRPPVAIQLPPGLSEDDLTAAGVVGPVQIEIIDAFGTVIIQGTPEDVRIIQGMLQQLETLSLENEPIIELVPMRHTDSFRVGQYAATLYQQIYQVRRGIVIMVPLVKPNTILIAGRQESVDAAKEIIAKLDTPAIPNASFRVFPLKHAAAQELQATITNSLAGRPGAGQYLAPLVGVIGDFRTNALIVQASPRDMLEIEAMIRELDIPGSPITTIVKRFPLQNSLATEMVTVLTNALNGGVGTRGTMLSFGGTDGEGNLLRSSVLYNVTIAPDTRGNSIIVTAPADTMALIAALIKELDRLPAAESRIRVFTLANGDAFTLTQMLTNLFGTTAAATGAGQVTAVRPGFEEGESTLVGVRFQAEIRTNSIVAIGSEADLTIAEALLLRLDAENLNNRTVFTMKLINTPADEIAQILNAYFTTERQFNIQNGASYLPNSPVEQYRMETNVIAEPASNSLIISTTPRFYEQVRKIVLAIDERPSMVAIDVLIAEVKIERSKDHGVELALQDSVLFSATGNKGNLGISTGTVPFLNTGSPTTVGSQGITSLIPASTVANGGFSFAASSESVSLFIRALETHTKSQVLARPRLVTLHNRNASIQVGERLPYAGATTYSAAGYPTTSTQMIDVGTILDITPRIMPDGMIAIALYVERSSLTGWRTIGNGDAPLVSTTNAQTTINALEGQSVVFAGLIGEDKKTENRSIPGLNKIPVVKHFFEYESKSFERKELLIVLTPRIIRTPEDMMLLNQQERERMSWCVSDVVRLTGDHSMRLRSDEWLPSEVKHLHGAPVILLESQLPAENRIPVPMFPVIETK